MHFHLAYVLLQHLSMKIMYVNVSPYRVGGCNMCKNGSSAKPVDTSILETMLCILKQYIMYKDIVYVCNILCTVKAYLAM